MRMLSVIIAGAAVLSVAPAIAKTSEEQSFKHEGHTYVYTVKEDGSSQYISGRSYPEGTTFALRVHDGYVTGTSGGAPVRFKVADAQGAMDKAAVELLTMR